VITAVEMVPGILKFDPEARTTFDLPGSFRA